MAITDPILLSPDVVLIPVADLPAEVRRKIDPGEGDWAITHPRSRTPSRIVGADSVELLSEFKEPRAIVEAVIRYSQARGLDPESVLEEAYPLLERLLSAGFLVAEGSEEAGGIESTLKPGDRIASFEVLECVQSLEDTEVYQVRGEAGIAALKIERRAGEGGNEFAREAAVLEYLGGTVARPLASCRGGSGRKGGGSTRPERIGPSPAGRVEPPPFRPDPPLHEAGGKSEDGRRWIALPWFPGVDAATAAAELRGRTPEGLLNLCRTLLAAYSRLHESGVLHGDIHPRNVLAGKDGTVHLIDFGLSVWPGAPGPPPGRGGVGFFFEPEYAMAVLAGEPAPAITPAGEQYAVAALLYLLLAGAHTHDFQLGRDAMLRQIAEEPPLPFAARGTEPGPGVEAALAKALAKDPTARYPSLSAFAEALGKVEVPAALPLRSRRSAAEALLSRVLGRIGMDGPLFRDGLPEPPRASVTYGAAGIACGLRRMALAREDAELASLADLWAEKAVRDGGDEGYYKPASRLDPGNVGRITPYHTASGVHAVRAQIAHTLGDELSRREAVGAFVAAAGGPCLNPDLTLGRSGVLLAAALLLDLGDDPGLRELGDRLLADLWEEIDPWPVVPAGAGQPNLGMAHGQAGFLYASLQWCRAAGRPVPPRLPERLAELASCARPWGRGLRWRWYAEDGRDSGTMAGWCNGSAGFVFLGTLAHRLLGDPAWLALAEGAAWNAWEAPDAHGTLCCGLAGRAYALLNLHRHGAGEEWLARARNLADRAAQSAERDSEASHSLYKGEVGVAVLAADLARPEGAAMPFFEEEGWG